MKKSNLLRLTVLAIALLAAGATQAQETKTSTASVKGTNFLNAGIGLGTFGFTGTGGLPITASFEHGFSDKISAGLSVGLVSTKYASYWKYNYYVIGARGSYHFNELLNVNNPKLDVYGGATLFYRGYSVKYNGPDEYFGKSSAGGLDIAIHAGGHYYFSENFGAFAELGWGISPLQLGVSLKF